MKKNIITLFAIICCMFTVGNVVSTANENQRAAQVNYHENSTNNGIGDARHVSATIAISNATRGLPLISGGQAQDEKSVPKQPAYRNDKIYFDIGVNIGTTSVPEERSFETLNLHVQFDENILINTSSSVEALVDGYAVYLSWRDVHYDAVNHTMDFSFKPEELGLQADYTGKISIRFNAKIAEDITSDDYIEMPLNLTATYKSLTGTEFISGVTSLFYADARLKGDLTIENLSSTSGKYRVGDEVQYTLNYQNVMPGSPIESLFFRDTMPRGFDYDTNSLKVYSVNQAGIETDITDELETMDLRSMIIINSKDELNLYFDELEAQMGIKLVYTGTITNDIETSVIQNHAFIRGTDSGNGDTLQLENTLETPVHTEGTVRVDYVDENGNKLAPSISISGDEGTPYSVEPILIKGYSVKEVPDNASGIYTTNDQTISFIYVLETITSIDPIDPVEPAKPEAPVESIEPVKPVAPTNPKMAPIESKTVTVAKEKISTLPYTGEKISTSLTVVGAVFLIGGSFLLLKNKKGSKQD